MNDSDLRILLSRIPANHLVKTVTVALAHRQQFLADLYPVFFDGLNFGNGHHVRLVYSDKGRDW